MLINFERSAKQRAHKDQMLVVATAKLDASWAKDTGFYIPPYGGGAEIQGRRASFQAFLASGQTVEPSSVCLGADGEVCFIDGRHRFSVLRDLGMRRVVICVPRCQVKKFNKYM